MFLSASLTSEQTGIGGNIASFLVPFKPFAELLVAAVMKVASIRDFEPIGLGTGFELTPRIRVPHSAISKRVKAAFIKEIRQQSRQKDVVRWQERKEEFNETINGYFARCNCVRRGDCHSASRGKIKC